MARNAGLKWFVFPLLLVTSGGFTSNFSCATPSGAELIVFHEAEILVYLVPSARAIRHQGMDIGWEEPTSLELNRQDYYFFWAYNSKRRSTGSVTVGHFAVNKHTGDVWDFMTSERITSTELEGVQRILRRAHRIDENALKSYQSADFWATKQ